MIRITFIIACVFSFNVRAEWSDVPFLNERDLLDVYFLDDNVGYVVGWSMIASTTNGGYSWDQKYRGGTAAFNAVHFLNDKIGFVVGYKFVSSSAKPLIMKTVDAGLNWSSTVFSGDGQISDIQFVSEFIGYAAASEGKVYKTVNGGVSWDTLQLGTNGDVRSIFFTDSVNGIAVGLESQNSPFIYRTTDGGSNWGLVPSPATRYMQSVFFPSKLIGYTICNDGKLLKTEDGGGSWKLLGTTQGTSDLFFLNDTVGFCVGSYNPLSPFGGVLKTVNGGETWDTFTPFLWTREFNAIHFSPSGAGYVVGPSGHIMKNSDYVTATEELTIPKFDIFPNPCTNVLNLIPGTLSFELFSIDGRFIEQGERNVLSTSNLQPGMYIIKMNDGFTINSEIFVRE